jgi:hypothetical protein
MGCRYFRPISASSPDWRQSFPSSTKVPKIPQSFARSLIQPPPTGLHALTTAKHGAALSGWWIGESNLSRESGEKGLSRVAFAFKK